MQLAEIHRYPVKSMLGEQLQQAEVGPNGILGDRAWALKDERRGELTGAKRFAALMDMRAQFTGTPTASHPSATVEIRARDRRLRSSDGDVNASLSELLDHPVSLWPLLPPEEEAHYRREPVPAGTDMEQVLRQVFARTEDEPIPEISAFPEVLATHHSQPGTYFDAFPLLIITRSALAELESRARGSGYTSNFDMRRFRPNLVIDTDDTGFVEDAWFGQHLRVGEAVLKIEMTCPRCIMTTHGFADLPKDPKVMRALVEHHGGELGVYASVVTPGPIRESAKVELA
ncbi:MAG: MOSC domain-containing protein [Gammaproteobacteria bacterium]|nr:MOSC domain-containing protein [Gammaproteobacteria bacterium]